ncbi:hypothetical protein EOM57_04050 [Candidatus Saccharibacteria bacterium]|nr:hypothetical protein [Candidatus Saccharibacteria bacterium]
METTLSPAVTSETVPVAVDIPSAVTAEQQASPEVSTGTCQRLGSAACFSCTKVTDCMFAAQLARGELNPTRDSETPEKNEPRVGEGRDALFDETIETVVASPRTPESTTQRPKPEAPATLDSTEKPDRKPTAPHATKPTESDGEPTVTAGAPLQNKQPATVGTAKPAEAKPRPTVERHQPPKAVQETPKPRSIDMPNASLYMYVLDQNSVQDASQRIKTTLKEE